jgi:hypothetical protein
MMEQSENIGKLAGALNKVQANELFALTDKKNPFFKSKYADLSSVWSVARQPLVENGLSVVQTFDVDQSHNETPSGDAPIIVTTLLHDSGQWIRGRLKVPITKSDPQAVGSSITYGRRYALSAILGICPEDDDAEKAMKTSRDGRPQQDKPASASNEISEKQKKFINGKMVNNGMDPEQRKAFFAWKNPKNSKEASDFIENFDTILAEYMEHMDGG